MPSKFLSMENQIIFIKIFQATIVICNHGKKKKLGISMALTLGSNWYQVCQIYDFTHIKEFIYFLTKFLVSFTFFSEEGSLMRYNTLIFSCMCMCDAPRPGRHKTVTTPEIIDQIHELILDHHWISAKSRAEQLGISREEVGSIIHEDLDMRKLSAKWVPTCLNADQKSQRCQSSEQTWKFFDAIQMISCRDWWPWTKLGYITMTRRQSNNQWSVGKAAHSTPKNSECKNPLENFSPRYFGIKTASFSLIIFQRAKLSTRSITHLCWCKWRTFWRKTPRKFTRGGGALFLHDNAPAHRALETHKKLAYLGFQCLDHPHCSPDLAPSDLFPGLKKQLEGRQFSSDAKVIAAAETWLDFFWVACKS